MAFQQLLIAGQTPAGPGGPIVRIGTPTQIESTVNSSSASITVPADATFIVIGVGGYFNNVNYFSAGAMTINSAAMTAVAGDGDTSAMMGAMFYKVNPSTGTQTLAWDWKSTDDPADGVKIIYSFYKNENTSTPVRSSPAGVQNAVAPPYVSNILTAVGGDLIVGWSWASSSSDEGSPTWLNATEVTAFGTRTGSVVGSWAEGSPLGDTTITAQVWGSAADGGIIGIVLRQ